MRWLENKLIKNFFSSVLIVLCLHLSSCATAPWEKSKYKNLPPESRALESAKDLELNPESTKARKEMLVSKESAENEVLLEADKARQAGDTESAIKLYEKVLSFAPDNQTAITSIKELETEKKLTKKLEKASEFMAKSQLQAAREIVREVLLEQPQLKQAKILNDLLLIQTTNGKIGLRSKDNSAVPFLKPWHF